MSAPHSLLKRAIRLSFAIFINKPIGLLRDILKIRYMGVGLIADAFSTAWRIPNSFRRIFGEGALSGVLVPTLAHIKHTHGDRRMCEVTTLLLFFFQIGIFVMCATIAYFASPLLVAIAPGAIDRAAYAIPLLRILVFFILAMSGSVILGSVLQIYHIFSLGPLSQFVLNVALCMQYFLCDYYKLSLVALSWMIIFDGGIIFAMHLYVYRQNKFIFCMPSREAWKSTGVFFKKFLPAMLGASMVEVNLFIDQGIASYLPVGSQSMFEYIASFIRIPLQVFGSSFATVSAPHFAELVHKTPRRLSFHLFESLKLMFWMTTFASICIVLFAYKGLYTLLLSKNFTIVHVEQGAQLMRIFAGIIFFSVINRVLINAYYALHETFLPTVLSIISTLVNTLITYAFMLWYGLEGIVAATVFVEMFKTALLLYFLKKKLHIAFAWNKWIAFCGRVLWQYCVVGSLGIILYFISLYVLHHASNAMQQYLFHTLLYWVWIGPIIALVSFLLFKSRRFFGITMYYLDKKALK